MGKLWNIGFALLLSAGVAHADHYRKYQPLKIGNEWTYQKDKWGGLSTVKVTQKYFNAYYLSDFPGASAWFWFGGNTLYAYNWDTKAWVPFLKFGHATGTTYTVNLGSQTMFQNVKVTIASKNAVVDDTVIQQKFTGCVRFSLSPPLGWGDAGIEELTFAPNVGLVRSSEQSFGGPVTSLLHHAVVGSKKIGFIGTTELESGGTLLYPGSNKLVLINTQAQLESFYNQYKPGETVPGVKFEKSSVVVVLAGGRPSGGYGVQVKVARWNFPYSGARIFVQENKPGPGVFVTLATTSPYQIVVLQEKAYSLTLDWKVVEYGPQTP